MKRFMEKRGYKVMREEEEEDDEMLLREEENPGRTAQQSLIGRILEAVADFFNLPTAATTTAARSVTSNRASRSAAGDHAARSAAGNRDVRSAAGNRATRSTAGNCDARSAASNRAARSAAGNDDYDAAKCVVGSCRTYCRNCRRYHHALVPQI